MPLPITWTPILDAALLDLRREGVTWDGVGRAIGVSRNSVLERARRLAGGPLPSLRCRDTRAMPRGPGSPLTQPLTQPPPTAGRARRAAAAAPLGAMRGPLPPGHAVSWGALTAGTLLDGAAYPAWTADRGHAALAAADPRGAREDRIAAIRAAAARLRARQAAAGARGGAPTPVPSPAPTPMPTPMPTAVPTAMRGRGL